MSGPDQTSPEELDPTFFDGLSEDSDAFDEAALGEAFAQLEARVGRERGPLAWLRSLRSSVRVTLGLSLSVGMVLAMALFSPRSDLDALPAWRILTVVGALAALFGASVWFGLRPLHRPAKPPWLEPLIVLGAVLGMAALAFLPLAPPMPHEHGDWEHAFKCIFSGTMFGFPAYVLIRVLDRGGRRISAFLAAAAAALSGNATIAMHCENDSLGHLLRGHATIGIIFVGAVAIWRWSISQLQSR